MEEKRYECDTQALKNQRGFIKSMRKNLIGGIICIVFCVFFYFSFVR